MKHTDFLWMLACALAVLPNLGRVDRRVLAQETTSPRWTAATVGKTSRKDWALAVREVDKEIQELTSGWLEVAGDPNRSDDERIDAILIASRFGRPEAIRFCLDNLGLVLNPKAIRGDGDMLKPTPCLFGLYSLRWQSIPHLLVECGDRPLSKEATRDFAFLFASICGPEVGRSILEQHRKKKFGNSVFLANTSAILERMR